MASRDSFGLGREYIGPASKDVAWKRTIEELVRRRGKVPLAVVQASQERAFDEALQNYPIDNRRMYETWDMSFKPHVGQPRPMIHLDPCADPHDRIREQYPETYRAKGEEFVRAQLAQRLQVMEMKRSKATDITRGRFDRGGE